MQKTLHKFFLAEQGATAIEYALIASLIAVVIAAVLGTVGKTLTGIFQQVENAF
jgi:pilus assembly protein Flp/PilA